MAHSEGRFINRCFDVFADGPICLDHVLVPSFKQATFLLLHNAIIESGLAKKSLFQTSRFLSHLSV